MCVLLVLTKRWHGALTKDFTDGIQKFHTAPTPRVGGVPIVLGLVFACYKAASDVKELLTPILLAGMPALLFGVAEYITKRVSVMHRLLAASTSLTVSMGWPAHVHPGLFGLCNDRLAGG